MADKNKSLHSGIGSLKLFIIVAAVILIAWVVGKGFLTVVASIKQM